jgi:excisionase family DNA binding protein
MDDKKGEQSGKNSIILEDSSKTRKMIPDDILNIKEAANFLRIPVSTIYKFAQEGKVPAIKVGKHWRFLKKDLQLLFVQKGKEHS